MNRILIGSAALLACAACNTVSGFGKDLQIVGETLTRNARDTATRNAQDTARVEAPRQSIPDCAPDYSRSPPVTCEEATDPSRTEPVRIAPPSRPDPVANTQPNGQ